MSTRGSRDQAALVLLLDDDPLDEDPFEDELPEDEPDEEAPDDEEDPESEEDEEDDDSLFAVTVEAPEERLSVR